jgi:hypothetical protein
MGIECYLGDLNFTFVGTDEQRKKQKIGFARAGVEPFASDYRLAILAEDAALAKEFSKASALEVAALKERLITNGLAIDAAISDLNRRRAGIHVG